jgi:hypothetical protein
LIQGVVQQRRIVDTVTTTPEARCRLGFRDFDIAVVPQHAIFSSLRVFREFSSKDGIEHSSKDENGMSFYQRLVLPGSALCSAAIHPQLSLVKPVPR